MVSPQSLPSLGALPVALTPLIGREREIGDVVGLIDRPDIHLVTVTGPGGVGKTRLAIAAATAASPSFPNGIWFVDLASVTDPQLAIPTIAKVLGLKEGGASIAVDWIASFLANKQVLIVLDNMEQIPDCALDIAQLVSTNQGLTVLATSRVRLRISGENQYPLSPLEVFNDADPSRPPGELAAVRLFADRAMAVQPDFQIDPTNALVVAEICRRLDGLPLAIELTAARISMFSPAAILDRLERRLPLLTSGSIDLPERQRTMQNAIGWSYDLLNSDEQTLLRRLSVFVGGFPIAAAESVASADPQISDSLTTLSHLFDLSLIRKIDSPLGDTRFGMLETVREFGRARLADAGELNFALEALVSWASSFMQDAGRVSLDLRREFDWRAKLDADFGNVRVAINWLLEHELYAAVLRLVGDLRYFWIARPYYLEVLYWLEVALEQVEIVDPLIREMALQVAVYGSCWYGQSEKAITFAEQAVRIGREIGIPYVIGQSMVSMGTAWESRDDPARALEWYEQALPFIRDSGENLWIALTLTEVGDKLVLLDKVQQSMPYFEEALSLMTQEEFEHGTAVVKGEWAFAELALGSPFSASKLFAESYELGNVCRDPRVQLGAAAGLAAVALALGEAKTSATLLGTLDSTQIAFGIVRPSHILHIKRLRKKVMASLGDSEFGLAFEQGKSVSLDHAVSEILLKFQAMRSDVKVRHSSNPSDLTTRELDVLRLLVQGKSDRDIADSLFIGSRTVQTHVSNLLAKLGVSNRAEAAAVAVREGLV